MKKLFVAISVSFLMFSCAVEQFQVNTKIESFENGGRIFGESTKGLKKNEDYTRSSTLFVIGINVISDYEINEMAKKIGAEHYTIETKRYLIGNLCRYFTVGLVDGKRVTVIKRAE